MLKLAMKTATFRQSQITVLGTIINGGLGALFYIVMARFLGPVDFGLLSVSIITLTLIADIADLGTNTGLIRFVSSNLTANSEKAFRFLKLSLKIKILVWSVILVLGYFLSPFFAQVIFNKPELTIPLKLVTIGVGGALLFSFTTSALQSLQKFFLWSAINIMTNLFRLLLIFYLFYISQLNLFSGIASYIILPFFGFSLALLFLPLKKIITVSGENSVAWDFFKFNKWVALFTFVAAISSRLDTYIIAALLSSREIGIYAAANQLTQVIPQIVGALGVVAAPKFASFQSQKEMLIYFKKFQLMVLGIALVGLLVIPPAFYIIPLIYGPLYSETIFPFIILFFGMLIFLISIPLHSSIIYYFGKPELFVWLSTGHLLTVALLGYYLTLSLGVVGAAIAVVIGMLLNLIVPLIWFLRKINK